MIHFNSYPGTLIHVLLNSPKKALLVLTLFACTPVINQVDISAQEGREVKEVQSDDTAGQRKQKSQRTSQPVRKYVCYQSVVYKSYPDSKDLTCDIYVPRGPGPFPTILMIHGGAWKSGTKLHMKGKAVTAAQRGFVAISINYRHAPRHKWPAQRIDCEAAMQWMLINSERYKIDKTKIAVWGYSAGGHLATFLATIDLPSKSNQKRKHPIRCVVCGGGPVDLTIVPKDFPFLSYFLGATRRQNPELYKSASPITHLSKDDPPMFFYHGERDFMVPISAVKSMVSSAKKLGIECELMMVPEKEHMLTFFDQASFEKGLAFIEKVLSKERVPVEKK